MEGKFRYSETPLRQKHTSMTFFFKDGSALSFDDTRKFGVMYLTNIHEVKDLPMIKKLGIEANNIKPSDHEILYTKFNKNKKIKELLLDQTILTGIGNIYADEILFATKINPFTKGKDLSKKQIDDICLNSNKILAKAIELGGSTIHSFHPSEGVDGRFQVVLKCYGHAGEECPNCHTKFHKTFIGGRGTTYCPNCQVNHELEKAIGITGPIGSGKSTALNHLKELGYNIYSADEIIHELYRDPVHKNRISRILQSEFDIDDLKKKTVCRKIMIDFPEKKKAVEDYIYPVLETELLRHVENEEKVAIEVPLLFKAHFEYMFKKIIVIKLNKEKQLSNLESRNEANPKVMLELNKDFHFDSSNKKIQIIENNLDLKSFLNKIDKIID